MLSVLRSIKPYWFYLICEMIKKIEIGKGMPKSEKWNKAVELYCSKDIKSFNRIPKEYQDRYIKYLGKVGARFVCEKVTEYSFSNLEAEYRITDIDISKTCLNQSELIKYGKSEPLYGWHISELKIYDEPRDLSDFKREGYMTEEEWLFSLYPHTHCHYAAWAKRFEIKGPPQSWFYVNELI